MKRKRTTPASLNFYEETLLRQEDHFGDGLRVSMYEVEGYKPLLLLNVCDSRTPDTCSQMYLGEEDAQELLAVILEYLSEHGI